MKNEESKRRLEVRFTEYESAPVPGEIQIIAPFDNWNDFGYKINCKAKLWNPRLERPFYFECFIGFLPPDKNAEEEIYNNYFKNYHREGRSLADMMGYIEHLMANNALDELRFFTMLPTMKDYRAAVEELGPHLLQDMLETIHDLVYFKNRSSSWFADALDSEVFNLGFMRNSEPFYAFNNADSILHGVDEERFEGISESLKLKYKLDGFENAHEVNLNYDQSALVPKRINILIGKNGIGKSQALNSFCRAALRYKDKNISLGVGEGNERPMINRLLAIGTPGETQNTFPAERRTSQKLYYRRLLLTRNARAKASKSINDMLIQLARSSERLGRKSRWNLFLDAIENILPLDSLVLRTKSNTYVKLKNLASGDGEQATLEKWAKVNKKTDPMLLISEEPYSMSSGQLTFFKFALLCCLYIENGSFVLLDEPETHMHPNMITDFVELLDEILENTGSLALIATHSAYFVREIPQDQVHVFKKEANNVCISNPRLITFGAPVDSISRFVFDDDAESKLAEKLYLRIKRQNTTFEDIVNTLGDEISVAAMMKLRQKMEEA
ncbi:AAA family ATPase [Vibrio anguillarum]|uniref:AAA family ATPase n=1 Tax=Vibrio anguillarum TaxID=55601 RepID=A0ABD4QRD0_VIBAN|nr:AAA family ATPase [Vibrio anguillarum]MBT2917640.1 AAA family ATPase [Vibrio anguillarum]